MIPSLVAVQSHVNGKKYKKALEWYRHDFSVYEPLIIQHKSKPHKLFCTLTQGELNKIPDQVKKHAEGKRFQRLKQIAIVEKNRKPVAQRPTEKELEENPDFWIPEEEVNQANADSCEDESESEEEDEEQPQNKEVGGQKRKPPKEEIEDEMDEFEEAVIVRKAGKGKKARKVLSTF